MIAEWHATGPAEMTFIPRVRDPDGPEYDDPGSLELNVPVEVVVPADEWDEVTGTNSTDSTERASSLLVIGLDELSVDRLDGPVDLEDASDESSIYALDRHQVVSVRELVMSPIPQGFQATVTCDINMPEGVQRLRLEFGVDRPSE